MAPKAQPRARLRLIRPKERCIVHTDLMRWATAFSLPLLACSASTVQGTPTAPTYAEQCDQDRSCMDYCTQAALERMAQCDADASCEDRAREFVARNCRSVWVTVGRRGAVAGAERCTDPRPQGMGLPFRFPIIQSAVQSKLTLDVTTAQGCPTVDRYAGETLVPCCAPPVPGATVVLHLGKRAVVLGRTDANARLQVNLNEAVGDGVHPLPPRGALRAVIAGDSSSETQQRPVYVDLRLLTKLRDDRAWDAFDPETCDPPKVSVSGCSPLLAYLKRYPAGRHAKEAQKRLTEARVTLVHAQVDLPRVVNASVRFDEQPYDGLIAGKRFPVAKKMKLETEVPRGVDVYGVREVEDLGMVSFYGRHG